jgi:lysine biosynthesis enzyme LysX
MELGIVLNRVNKEEKQLLLACKKHNVRVNQFNNQRMTLNLEATKDIEPKVDVFLQRSLSLSRGLYTTAIIESKGYNIINSYDCIHKSGDKLLSTLILNKNDIPSPKTWVGFTADSALEISENELSYPVITKPIIGSWGRMVAKVNDRDSASAIFEAKDVMGNIFQKIHYIQEYVDTKDVREDAPTDIRVLYIGGNCVAAMGRYRTEKDFRSNIAIGGTAKPYDITPEVEKLCKKIADAFKGEILGIDLMETKDGYTCIEVNGTPGFEAVSRATNVDIGEEIILYLKEKYA